MVVSPRRQLKPRAKGCAASSPGSSRGLSEYVGRILRAGWGAKESIMYIRFWGTRGSLAKPGPTTLRYGGNTSCVEIRTADGTLVVLDCGTGAHGLGQALLASGERPLRGHLLITHTHWDHIQGFPFFAPLFVPGSEWDLYAPGGLGQQLEATLAGQMAYTYFPVRLDELGATLRCHDL